jgi:hypothetical protein
MVADPMVFLPAATGAMGLWVLVTGRAANYFPRWPWKGAALRVAGAFCLFDSLVVIMLALAGKDGLAFMTYGTTTLAFAALAVLAERRAAAL